jgi:type II secretory pathway pseudopilin PulG
VTTGNIIAIVVIVILIAAIIGLYFWGKKLQKKQDDQQAQLKAMAQNYSMLIIDKKRMKIKDAGLPAAVLENTPKYLRGSKVPVVKAKVGPRVMSLLCDEKVFPNVPVKKEVKAVVSGLYITEVKGIRGSVDTTQTEKKGFFAKFKKNK